jgi:hypothetical protein
VIEKTLLGATVLKVLKKIKLGPVAFGNSSSKIHHSFLEDTKISLPQGAP